MTVVFRFFGGVHCRLVREPCPYHRRDSIENALIRNRATYIFLWSLLRFGSLYLLETKRIIAQIAFARKLDAHKPLTNTHTPHSVFRMVRLFGWREQHQQM